MRHSARKNDLSIGWINNTQPPLTEGRPSTAAQRRLISRMGWERGVKPWRCPTFEGASLEIERLKQIPKLSYDERVQVHSH